MTFDLERFHADAVRTPSHAGVEAMRELLRETLREAGVASTVDDLGNVLGCSPCEIGITERDRVV